MTGCTFELQVIDKASGNVVDSRMSHTVWPTVKAMEEDPGYRKALRSLARQNKPTGRIGKEGNKVRAVTIELPRRD